MTLAELAFASYCYQRLNDYDESYATFLTTTGTSPDLSMSSHRKSLLVWLNQWGCRQFAVEYHGRASAVLRTWHRKFGHSFFPEDKPIWQLTEEDLIIVGKGYTALVDQVASLRRKGRSSVRVTFGPTGVAKIFFAFRRNALVPWDDPIRQHYDYDGSADSYLSYLRRIKSQADNIKSACEQHGIPISDLPAQLGRPLSSVAKLIDEANWLTITRKLICPTPEILRLWARWVE